ncbi:hypothetical protein NHH03_17620, partial [Stieleria sp. TO1_6]|uniref:hypothetical protein n=1 Tax=Stieleria tagensis TaxID=2956795 RepID=UPI00209B56BB
RRAIALNEPPEYGRASANLQADFLQWVSIPFDDPEGGAVVSVNGNPQEGFILFGEEGLPSNTAYWVPQVGGTSVPSNDEFDVTASDGNSTSDPTTVNITINHSGFGQFELGNTAPPKDKDTDPGAINVVALIPTPSAGWNTVPATAEDHANYAGIPLAAWYLGYSQEAKDAMEHFRGNTGAHRSLDVRQILLDTNSTRWDSAISYLVGLVHGKHFVGTLELVDKEVHLEGTHGTVWQRAVGEYTGWSTATITGSYVDGKFGYSVTHTYNMWDPYDWDPNKPESTNQPAMARLHLAGLAQQYMTSGSITTTVTWNEDDPLPTPQL